MSYIRMLYDICSNGNLAATLRRPKVISLNLKQK